MTPMCLSLNVAGAVLFDAGLLAALSVVFVLLVNYGSSSQTFHSYCRRHAPHPGHTGCTAAGEGRGRELAALFTEYSTKRYWFNACK